MESINRDDGNNLNQEINYRQIFWQDLFYVSFFTLAFYSALEMMLPGLIIFYVNINYLFGLTLMSGIIMIFVSNHYDKK